MVIHSCFNKSCFGFYISTAIWVCLIFYYRRHAGHICVTQVPLFKSQNFFHHLVQLGTFGFAGKSQQKSAKLHFWGFSVMGRWGWHASSHIQEFFSHKILWDLQNQMRKSLLLGGDSPNKLALREGRKACLIFCRSVKINPFNLANESGKKEKKCL